MANIERGVNNQEAERFVTKRIVVKIGTSTITAGKDKPDRQFMTDIARQVAQLHKSGVNVLIVSSGAVDSGKNKAFPRRDMVDKQVEALFGQPRLMASWISAFRGYEIKDVGQVLVTDVDLIHKANVSKEVLTRALARGVVIVNCNDTITSEEMRKIERSADNDKLAADVARLVGADTLLILTDVDGVMDGEELIPIVDRLEDIEDLLHNCGSGTGGARTKWATAKDAAKQGKRSIIANGREKDAILRVAKGENVGTRFIQGYMLY